MVGAKRIKNDIINKIKNNKNYNQPFFAWKKNYGGSRSEQYKVPQPCNKFIRSNKFRNMQKMHK